MEKGVVMIKLHSCHKCEIAKYRRKIVIGRGTIPAVILFIGEAPGKSEDVAGEPFVGRSGQLLEEMIDEAVEMAGILRPSSYITNTVQCRPTDEIGGANREPTKEEMLDCLPRLVQVMETVNPQYIVFIGKVAATFHKKTFQLPYYELVHPSYLLRGGGTAHPDYIRIVRKFSDQLKKWSLQ